MASNSCLDHTLLDENLRPVQFTFTHVHVHARLLAMKWYFDTIIFLEHRLTPLDDIIFLVLVFQLKGQDNIDSDHGEDGDDQGVEGSITPKTRKRVRKPRKWKKNVMILIVERTTHLLRESRYTLLFNIRY